jgi:uncharacterized membrane protein
MTKEAFLAALGAHLRGLPLAAREEILADYASYFDEGVAAGRREDDIAAALGEPSRLARELRAQAGLKRWDEERSPAAAAGAILAILSLGAIDLLILLPVLVTVFSLILVFALVAAGMIVGGLVMLIAAPFGSFGGGLLPTTLGGVGVFAGGLSLAALQALIVIGLTNLLIRYGRFHVRLIKPIAA